jgi:hypothetical protein
MRTGGIQIVTSGRFAGRKEWSRGREGRPEARGANKSPARHGGWATCAAFDKKNGIMQVVGSSDYDLSSIHNFGVFYRL